MIDPSATRRPSPWVARFFTNQGAFVRNGMALLLLAGIAAAAAWLHGMPGRGTNAALVLLLGGALGVIFERGRFCYFAFCAMGSSFGIQQRSMPFWQH